MDYRFIRVATKENDSEDSIISFPIADEHEIISLMSIQGQFSHVIGLKYNNGRGWIAIHQDASGLHPPPEGWLSVPLYITALETEIANVGKGGFINQCGSWIVKLGLGGLAVTAYYYTSLENQGKFLNVLLELVKNNVSMIRSINPGSLLVELQFNCPKKFLQFVNDCEAGNVERRFSEEYSKIGIKKVTVELKNKEEISKQRKEIGEEEDVSEKVAELDIEEKGNNYVKTSECVSVCSLEGKLTWKNCWITDKGEDNWPKRCSKSRCTNTASVGTHVHKKGEGEKKVFIIPLCRGCSYDSDSAWMKVADTTKFAPIEIKEDKTSICCHSKKVE